MIGREMAISKVILKKKGICNEVASLRDGSAAL